MSVLLLTSRISLFVPVRHKSLPFTYILIQKSVEKPDISKNIDPQGRVVCIREQDASFSCQQDINRQGTGPRPQTAEYVLADVRLLS